MSESETNERDKALHHLVPAIVMVGILIAVVSYRAELSAWFDFGSEASSDTNAGDKAPAHDAHSHEDDIAHYTCPMHPSVKADAPGQCPICAMDLTPVTVGEQASGVLRVDELRAQKIGVRYTTVELKSLARSVNAVGEVNADENRLADVTLRSAGWVDKLYVEETGEYVKRGQTLLELYSPDVLAASEEVLAARRAVGTTRERMIAAADRKLLLLGVTTGQLKRLVARGTARDRVSVSSPTNGYVVEKNIVQGEYVDQGASLLRIADLSQVWVDAQVYEADLSLVKLGQKASVTLPFVPGQRFEGSIDYVHPKLDPQTRTVRVRITLDNPDLLLRPGMYADVAIEVELGERLVVPQEAIVYSGKRRLVFVDLGEGRLIPKQVRTGVSANGLVEVLAGLSAGERIVSSGNFLIAAESRIRSATTTWSDETVEAPPEAKRPPPVESDETIPVDSKPPSTKRPKAKPHEKAHHKLDDKPHDPTTYTCPMHAQVVQDAPGQCPICHMNLVEQKANPSGGTP